MQHVQRPWNRKEQDSTSEGHEGRMWGVVGQAHVAVGAGSVPRSQGPSSGTG